MFRPVAALLLAAFVMPAAAQNALPFVATPIAKFDTPWAMTFLPDGRMLVTERGGKLLLVAQDGKVVADVAGVPAVYRVGRAGLFDVILHPAYAKNGVIYFSYAEAGEGNLIGGAVARARLVIADGGARLDGVKVIWRQVPKTTGDGHFSGRLAFAPDGHLFITSGDRQKFTPAQDMAQNLGKVIRLNEDGSVPADNPFADKGGVTAQIWSLGHRNLLGIAFDADGRLWEEEMGPKGGDEVNLIARGRNHGWPLASNGSHYDNEPVADHDIPDHRAGDGFEPPKVWWNPSISPSGLIIYSGKLWPQWKGDAFHGGLSSQALLRIDLDGAGARKGDQWNMGQRIREVEEGPDGAIWLLEDTPSGRLLKLTPAR